MTVIEHCRRIAAFTDEPGVITRTFLTPAARDCLNYFIVWAKRIGLREVHIDSAGNFRATLPGQSDRRLVIGSHLDTVNNAGAFDGVLGVVLGMAIAEAFQYAELACTLEIVGFSEEEGVRFAKPFIGSVGFVGGLNEDWLSLKDPEGLTVRQHLNSFGLTWLSYQPHAAAAYLEFHIEQGPLLENIGLPLAVVSSIAGQTRATVSFIGKANHAGTTPMDLRRDAFCAAAEWSLFLEAAAHRQAGLVATVGSVQVLPGATNVVPGRADLSMDVRHSDDDIRHRAMEELLQEAKIIASRRHLDCEWQVRMNQDAVRMDPAMVRAAERAVAAAGVQPLCMTSGAGHDAMILAADIPSAMIFLRSPGGISHHPDESVLEEDVELAFLAGRSFVENFV